MPMKITRLTSHWEADQAHTILEFLDRLREQLWELYGDDIIDLLQEAAANPLGDEHHAELPFDDDIPF
jgi:hypothetical protein